MSDESRIFKILEKVGESGLKIQLDGSDGTAETIQLSNKQVIKSKDDQPGLILTTEDGRQFGRLDSWPEDVLVEIH
jgi:hypothetical protein